MNILFPFLICLIPINQAVQSPTVIDINGGGIRNTNGIPLTGSPAVTDKDAKYGEFPWVALLAQESIVCTAIIHRYIGVGSLIHPQIVVSTAHQLSVGNWSQNIGSLRVRLGEWHLKFTEPSVQIKKVIEVKFHEHFNQRNAHYNIALLLLESRATYTASVGRIGLSPPQPSQQGPTTDDCVATGWGKLDMDTVYYSEILKKREMKLVPKDLCEMKTLSLFSEVMHVSELCAGGVAGVDMCRGDAGAPLVCPFDIKKNQYYLTGMVTRGVNCDQRYPGIVIRSNHIPHSI